VCRVLTRHVFIDGEYVSGDRVVDILAPVMRTGGHGGYGLAAVNGGGTLSNGCAGSFAEVIPVVGELHARAQENYEDGSLSEGGALDLLGLGLELVRAHDALEPVLVCTNKNTKSFSGHVCLYTYTPRVAAVGPWQILDEGLRP